VSAPSSGLSSNSGSTLASTIAPTIASTIAPTIASGLASGLASRRLLRLGRRLPAHVRQPWSRTNHAGRTVTLLEGPAWVGGAVAGAVAGALTGALVDGAMRGASGRGRAASSASATAFATTFVAAASGSLGALDDLAGGAADKGLKGHLGALSRGEVTTGAVKIVGLGLTGLAGAAVVDRSRGARGATSLLSTLVGGAVVAAAANAVNLFDLRPGRALKVTVAAGLPLVASTPASAAVGSSLGVAQDDLAATSMLGDTGANAAGALVGLALVERFGLAGRTAALIGLTALTLASERVSFTRVIEGNAALRRIDEWGRAGS
jgi:hypothetical protein